MLPEKPKLSGHHFPQFKAIISGKTVYSDDVIGYQSTLFSIPNSLPKNHLEIAKQTGIADFNKNSAFNLFQTDIQNWLGENNVDFVIVRPDKIIFGAGKKGLFTQIVEDFQV